MGFGCFEQRENCSICDHSNCLCDFIWSSTH